MDEAAAQAMRDSRLMDEILRAARDSRECWAQLAMALMLVQAGRAEESLPYFQGARERLVEERAARLIDWSLELLLAGEHQAARKMLEDILAREDVEADLRPLLFYHLSAAYRGRRKPCGPPGRP
jgi:hypothetical protein